VGRRSSNVDGQARSESLKDAVTELERQRIIDALKACGGNQTRAAEMLGISRRTLVNRLDQYDLPRPRKEHPTR
jgi:DNA-binding NtrC family response regulator